MAIGGRDRFGTMGNLGVASTVARTLRKTVKASASESPAPTGIRHFYLRRCE